MKKTLLFIFFATVFALSSQAKVKFGLRGGYDISKMEFNSQVLNSDHRDGFFVGPTIRIGLIGGFDLDASALYEQKDVKLSSQDGENEYFKKKSALLQVNLRKAFGFGTASDIFIFGGPQWDVNFGDRSQSIFEDGKLNWKKAPLSVNVGVGAMLFRSFELKASYNISCESVSNITMKYLTDEIRESPKGSTWQLGLSVYF